MNGMTNSSVVWEEGDYIWHLTILTNKYQLCVYAVPPHIGVEVLHCLDGVLFNMSSNRFSDKIISATIFKKSHLMLLQDLFKRLSTALRNHWSSIKT